VKTKIMFSGVILVAVLGIVLYWIWPRAEAEPETQNLPVSQTGMEHEHDMEHEHAMGQQGGMGPMAGMDPGMMNTGAEANHDWSVEEIEVLRSLWIGSLPPLPPDPSNQYADDPRAAALGHKLFFETRFSSNGAVSCATCHVPALMFQDSRPLGVGVGVSDRRTMTVVSTAYSPWYFWDGRADSQWAQALGPIENPVEHGTTRSNSAHVIYQNYRAEYEATFGPLPDLADTIRFPLHAGPVEDPEARAAWEGMSPEDREAVNRVYANMGKAIAAYERLILPGPSRFDVYVEAVLAGDEAAMNEALTPDEVAGLRLFIGDGNCIQCHNGPLFTNNSFHNTGVPPRSGTEPDVGRQTGVKIVLEDEFNCLGPYSDAAPEACVELRFLVDSGEELAGAFKVPTLRNVALAAPYMHGGQFGDLFSVLRHYRHVPPAAVGVSELEPLPFMGPPMMQVVAFLDSLTGPLATPAEWLAPP
jgi:cytochrome c peroxidase